MSLIDGVLFLDPDVQEGDPWGVAEPEASTTEPPAPTPRRGLSLDRTLAPPPTSKLKKALRRLGISKHYPGGHDHDQSRHGRRSLGTATPTPTLPDYTEHIPDDLKNPPTFAPFGDNVGYALKRILALPMFEDWSGDFTESPETFIVTLYPKPGANFRGLVTFEAEKAVDDGGFLGTSDPSWGAADDILLQARALEAFYDNPKGRRLWDMAPNVLHFTHRTMTGSPDGRSTIRAAGLFRPQESTSGVITVTSQWNGRTRSTDSIIETIAHEYGHKLDWLSRNTRLEPVLNKKPRREYWSNLYSHPEPVGVDAVAESLPVRSPWAKFNRFVLGSWEPTRTDFTPMSQRLLDRWAYPGQYRSSTELFATAVEYWVTEPRVLSDTARAFNRSNQAGNLMHLGPKWGNVKVYDGPFEKGTVMVDVIESLLAQFRKALRRLSVSLPTDEDLGSDRKVTDTRFVEGMSYRELRRLRAADALAKHMGPGPHPSGSDQDVHRRKTDRFGQKTARTVRRETIAQSRRIFDGTWFRPADEVLDGPDYTRWESSSMERWQIKSTWQSIREMIEKGSLAEMYPVATPEALARETESITRIIGELDSAVSKWQTTEDIVLFRGRGFPAEFGKLQVGDTWANPHFVSMTSSLGDARSYAADRAEVFGFKDEMVLEIRIPKGYHLGAPHLDPGETDPFEEYILPRGSKFKVRSVETRPWSEHTGETYEYVVVDLIDEFQVRKHYGPDDHPSGSPQTVHRGGMSVGTQPTLDNDPHPNPVADLTFRRAEDADFVAGGIYRSSQRDFSPEEISSIKLAVEEFEAAYPGLLPPDLQFIYYRAPADYTGAFTWTPKVVRTKDGAANAVFVNEWIFTDPAMLKQIMEDFDQQSISTTLDADDIDGFRTRIIFHELAHIAETQVDLKLRAKPEYEDWVDYLPFYNGEWYASRLEPDSDLLPSPYAAESKSEFLAEALSDAWYNGDDAAPISKLSVSQFRLLTSGDVDEAQRLAMKWWSHIRDERVKL